MAARKPVSDRIHAELAHLDHMITALENGKPPSNERSRRVSEARSLLAQVRTITNRIIREEVQG